MATRGGEQIDEGEGVAEGVIVAAAEVFGGGSEAEVVKALIVGDDLVVAVEHAFDNFGGLFDAVDDGTEEDADGVVGQLRASVTFRTSGFAGEDVEVPSKKRSMGASSEISVIS